ncbi:uncharacterized mitochondrial protein-like protein [Tanacetum coccineum]|uniref:Uncharacterized mitochondrial protein-like protein n=1 Tax=Tanacetum coccineum TaxID=301880 RepID=A0ABQ5GBN3_9ASTR
MSNTNNTMQTQTSNTLHNAIMEAGGKDRPLMLAPGNYVEWKSLIKRYINTKLNHEIIYYYLKNPPYQYKFKTTNVDIDAPPATPNNDEIDNDIYSTVDACPNAMEMWKAIERLKQEWQRFVTIVKKSQDLKNVSYHKLYVILKQHQNEVNEIRAKRLARTANPLALVAQQQPVYHPQTYPTHYTQNSSTRSQQAATRNKGKAIINSPQPTYDPKPEVKIYKATNNNLKTSSNTRNLNVGNTLRSIRGTGYDQHPGQYDNQRAVNVVGARENVGTQVVQQTGIQCFNCKEFRHVARECQKPKWPRDSAYHKEKMLLCKQEEARIQLSAEQVDWRDDTDDEPEDQELEAH